MSIKGAESIRQPTGINTPCNRDDSQRRTNHQLQKVGKKYKNRGL